MGREQRGFSCKIKPEPRFAVAFSHCVGELGLHLYALFYAILESNLHSHLKGEPR